MAGFSGLYEQVDDLLAVEEGASGPILPMWALMLYIAEPAGLRSGADLERARQALLWAGWLWNLVRMPLEARRREAALRTDALEEFVGLRDSLEMLIRASSWMDDPRVVARVRVEVEPTGAWRIEVVSGTPPTPGPGRSCAP
jgi:hypothetical protein